VPQHSDTTRPARVDVSRHRTTALPDFRRRCHNPLLEETTYHPGVKAVMILGIAWALDKRHRNGVPEMHPRCSKPYLLCGCSRQRWLMTVTLCRRFSGGVRYYDPASRPFAYSQHRMISRIRVVVDLRRRGTLAIMQLPVRIDVVAAHAAGIKPLKTRQGPASVVLLRGRSISVDRSFSARARCRTTGI
jgi:hypothetical protein